MSENSYLERMVKGFASGAAVVIAGACSGAGPQTLPPVAQPMIAPTQNESVALPARATAVKSKADQQKPCQPAGFVYSAKHFIDFDGARVFPEGGNDYFKKADVQESLVNKMIVTNDKYFVQNPTADTKQDWEDMKDRIAEGNKVVVEITPIGVIYALDGFGQIRSTSEYKRPELTKVDDSERIANYAVPKNGTAIDANYAFPFAKEGNYRCKNMIEKIANIHLYGGKK